jgi:hypothetical protein
MLFCLVVETPTANMSSNDNEHRDMRASITSTAQRDVYRYTQDKQD